MERETPLLGLPLTIKESIKVKGMSNQSGRLYKKKFVADEDAPVVKNARQKGAIILCVTNTPELCLFWETYNKVTGMTRNPYDVERTPGGSSGGEAALIASGASLIGLGSDVAGSCRLPAMFTGIYGHKPTPFVCSPYGHHPGSDDPAWGTFFTTGKNLIGSHVLFLYVRFPSSANDTLRWRSSSLAGCCEMSYVLPQSGTQQRSWS